MKRHLVRRAGSDIDLQNLLDNEARLGWELHTIYFENYGTVVIFTRNLHQDVTSR